MSTKSDLFQIQTPHFPERLCNEVNEYLFFSEKDSEIEQAKTICQSCLHIKDCGKGALDEKEEFGVFGGVSAKERKSNLKKQNKGAGRGNRKGKGVNYDRMPRVLALRAQGLPNHLIAESMALDTKQIERVLELAVKMELLPPSYRGFRVANNEKTHCNNGHEFTFQNTYLRAQKGGTARYCKKCRSQWGTSFRQSQEAVA